MRNMYYFCNCLFITNKNAAYTHHNVSKPYSNNYCNSISSKNEQHLYINIFHCQISLQLIIDVHVLLTN